MPIIPALRSLRQEDLEFEANLGYVVRPCLKKARRQRLVPVMLATWEVEMRRTVVRSQPQENRS
jgi:hypothetical protein